MKIESVKSNEPVIEEPTVTFTPADADLPETFMTTMQLRWIVRYEVNSTGVAMVPVKVLQQKQQGNRGTVKWEDIPNVKGDQE